MKNNPDGFIILTTETKNYIKYRRIIYLTIVLKKLK